MTRGSRDGATLPRRAVLAAAATLIAGSAFAQTPPSVRRTGDRARGGRLTLPVRIDGEGPFVFAIDTAASASVVADDLAVTLGLADAGRVAMHTLIGREMVGACIARQVSSGDLNRQDVRLALGTRGGLDGVDGLIGADLLAGHRLVLDFRGRSWARISRSRLAPLGFFDARNAVSRLATQGRQSFGGLITIEGHSRGAAIQIIIDTGAQVSLINRAAMAGGRASPLLLEDGTQRVAVVSPTGRSAVASAAVLDDLHFAGIALRRLPVLAGDFHAFAHWGYGDVPAMLLGVDVLGLFETVIIDLERGEVAFRA